MRGGDRKSPLDFSLLRPVVWYAREISRRKVVRSADFVYCQKLSAEFCRGWPWENLRGTRGREMRVPVPCAQSGLTGLSCCRRPWPGCHPRTGQRWHPARTGWGRLKKSCREGDLMPNLEICPYCSEPRLRSACCQKRQWSWRSACGSAGTPQTMQYPHRVAGAWGAVWSDRWYQSIYWDQAGRGARFDFDR